MNSFGLVLGIFLGITFLIIGTAISGKIFLKGFKNNTAIYLLFDSLAFLSGAYGARSAFGPYDYTVWGMAAVAGVCLVVSLAVLYFDSQKEG